MEEEIIQTIAKMGNLKALTMVSTILIQVLEKSDKKDLSVMEAVMKDVRKTVKTSLEGRGWKTIN